MKHQMRTSEVHVDFCGESWKNGSIGRHLSWY